MGGRKLSVVSLQTLLSRIFVAHSWSPEFIEFSFFPELLSYRALSFNLRLNTFYQFQVQRCSILSAPKNGWISPWFCSTESPVYGSSCKVGCHFGFREISGVDQFFCGSNGQWSNETSKIMHCEGKLHLGVKMATGKF